MSDNVGREGTGQYAGLVWDGKKWVPASAGVPQPRKKSKAPLVLALLAVLLLSLVVSCRAITSQPAAPPPPCPESTADDLGGAFMEGFNNGFSGCR